jgi:hypothetical protein
VKNLLQVMQALWGIVKLSVVVGISVIVYNCMGEVHKEMEANRVAEAEAPKTAPTGKLPTQAEMDKVLWDVNRNLDEKPWRIGHWRVLGVEPGGGPQMLKRQLDECGGHNSDENDPLCGRDAAGKEVDRCDADLKQERMKSH